MEQVIQIQKLGQYRLDNALHFRFHSLVCQEVHAIDAEKIGIPQALLDEYQACVDDEADAIKEVVEVTETKKITRKDSECDRRLSFILGMVRIMRLSPRAEEAEAAEQLYLITRMKKRIQIEGQGRKAARIWSLLTDLKKPEAAAWLTLLRLNEAVDLLEKTNNEAERLQAQRTSIQGEKKSRPSFTKIRPRTDKVYHDVLLRLQFAYMDGKAPIDREAITEVVNSINQFSNHIRTAYKQSLAQRRAKRRAKEEPPEQP